MPTTLLLAHTANPFAVMTTGISLCSNSHREFPVMNTGSLQWEQGFPVMKTGFSLWEFTTQGKPFSGPLLALYGILVLSLNLMSLNQDRTVFATLSFTKFRNQLLTNISDHKCNPVKSRCNLEYFSSFFLPRARILCVKIWFKNSVVFTMPWPRRKSEVGGRQTFFPAFNVGVVIFHHVYQQIVGFHLHFF